MPTLDLTALIDRRDPPAIAALVRDLVAENAALRQENERLAIDAEVPHCGPSPLEPCLRCFATVLRSRP